MSPDRVNNDLAPLRNERNACLSTLARIRSGRRKRKKNDGRTHKLITITKRRAGNPRLHEARTVRGEERMRRTGKRRGAQLGESKYNYTKVSRNTETESRGNRRVSLKLESCFETARLPCRLQPRHRRALPFP